MDSNEESWKDLAIKLARLQGHDVRCQFRVCTCEVLEERKEVSATIFRKMRKEDHGTT